MSRDFALWHTEGNSAPPARRHIAVVPGHMVALHRVDLPDRIRGTARFRVARSMFAPTLADPLETLDIVPLVPRAKSRAWSTLQVVCKTQIAALSTRITPSCLSIVPDYLTLPYGADLWVLTLQGTGDDLRIVVRASEDRGFAAEPDLAGAILTRWLAQRPPQAVVFQDQPSLAALPDAVTDVFAAVGLAIEPLRDGQPGLEWPTVEDLRRIDLRGTAAGSEHRVFKTLRRVRAPLIAAGLAGLVWLSALAFETRQMNATASADRRLIETLVQRNLLPSAPILDLRAQVRREIAARTQRVAGDATRDGPLDMLRAVSGALTATGITTDSLQYAPQTGLLLAVRGPGFETLDALMAALADLNLAATMVEARAAEIGVVAQVAVGAGGGRP